jgi:hypothetical protein
VRAAQLENLKIFVLKKKITHDQIKDNVARKGGLSFA